MWVARYSCSASSAAGAVVTVLRWLFSSALENGMPPSHASPGASCQPAISNAMIPSTLPSSALL